MALPQAPTMTVTITNVHTMFMKRKPTRQVWRRVVVVVTGITATVSLLLWLLYNNNEPT